jgi:hypothetical protein
MYKELKNFNKNQVVQLKDGQMIINGQQIHEKMYNIINRQESTNQNNELLSHPR